MPNAFANDPVAAEIVAVTQVLPAFDGVYTADGSVLAIVLDPYDVAAIARAHFEILWVCPLDIVRARVRYLAAEPTGMRRLGLDELASSLAWMRGARTRAALAKRAGVERPQSESHIPCVRGRGPRLEDQRAFLATVEEAFEQLTRAREPRPGTEPDPFPST